MDEKIGQMSIYTINFETDTDIWKDYWHVGE